MVSTVYSCYCVHTWSITVDSLQSFANDIANTVDVDHILLLMVQEDLLTPNQFQYLNSSYHTASRKQQKLCSIVIELSEDCVDKFIQCLYKTSDYEPHKKLYDKLYESRQLETTV